MAIWNCCAVSYRWHLWYSGGNPDSIDPFAELKEPWVTIPGTHRQDHTPTAEKADIQILANTPTGQEEPALKRWLLYIVILGLTIAAPAKPVNIGNLIPVRAMGVYQTGNQIRIDTDTGNTGIGDTAVLALCDLKDSASGIVYLDKTEYLILTEQTQDAAEALREELSGNTRVYITQYPLNLTQAPEFLSVHCRLPKLKHWKKPLELPGIGDSRKISSFSEKREKRY